VNRPTPGAAGMINDQQHSGAAWVQAQMVAPTRATTSEL
jgi:hypothetical protein